MSLYKKNSVLACFGLVLLSHSAWADNKPVDKKIMDTPPAVTTKSLGDSLGDRHVVIASNFKRHIIRLARRRS